MARGSLLGVVGRSLLLVAAGEALDPSPFVCGVCKAAVGAARLSPFLAEKVELPLVMSIASQVCRAIKAGHECDPTKHSGDPNFRPCEDVCKGMMAEEGAVIFELIQEKTLTTEQICGAIEGACPRLPVVQPNVSEAPIFKSNLGNLEGEMQVDRWAEPKLRTKKFVHISDVHLQLDYTPGTETDCGQPMCCRSVVGPAKSAETAADVFGDDSCDLPPSVLDLMLDHALSHDPDFVIQTGDDPAHDVWHQTQDSNRHTIETMSAGLAKRFSKVPVANALGNHGAAPVNQYRGPGADAWLYVPAAQAWSQWMPEDAKVTMTWGGFYQMRLLPKLRAVVVHSTLWAQEDNWFFAARGTDWINQLSWARDVLDQIRARGEKALWLMHHPGGASFGPTVQQLFREYEDVIVASFVGHAHTTWFTATPPVGNSSGMVEYCTGGDMGGHGNDSKNPTYRVFEYEVDEQDNFVRLVDFEQYYMDYESANKNHSGSFQRLFSAKEAYGLEDLSAKSWRALAESWLQGGPEADQTWERYASHLTRGKAPASEQDRKGWACRALHSTDDAGMASCLGVKSAPPVVHDPSCLDVKRGLGPLSEPSVEIFA